MEYECQSCGMGVCGLTCSKCHEALEHDQITTEHGETVNVCKCPQGCGMIKSPTCCQQDMACRTDE